MEETRSRLWRKKTRRRQTQRVSLATLEELEAVPFRTSTTATDVYGEIQHGAENKEMAVRAEKQSARLWSLPVINIHLGGHTLNCCQRRP